MTIKNVYGSNLKVEYHKCIKGEDGKNKTTSSMEIYEEGRLINILVGYNADDIEKILKGEEDISNYRLKNKKGDDEMRFQIIDNNGDVIDKDLSYESALMYIDNVVGKYYIM